MARLPQPGGDKGSWGSVLNDFLSVEHNSDGTLKNTGSISAYAPLANPIFTGTVTVPAPVSATDAVTKTYVDNLIVSGTPDASPSSKGVVQLTGHLAGSASNPQIANGVISDSHISASADIAKSKLAALNVDDGDVASGANIAQSKIAGLTASLSDKVNTSTLINGKALSADISLDPDDLDDTATTNKFVTAAEKSKLSGVAVGAEANVNADWNAGSGDAQILNKPTIPIELSDLDTSVTGGELDGIKSKLDGIESGANITNATNVDAAGATMNTDASLVGNSYFLDEDNMASNSATKVPSQQSVKTYTDDAIVSLPELNNGTGTRINTTTPGILRVDNVSINPGTLTTISNTTTESSVMGGAQTLNLVVGDRLRISSYFAVTNNSGSSRDFTFRFKVGGTTVLSWVVPIPTGSTNRGLRMQLDCIIFDFLGLRPLSGGTLSVSNVPAADNSYTSATTAVGVSSPNTIDLTVQHSVASADVITITSFNLIDRSKV